MVVEWGTRRYEQLKRSWIAARIQLRVHAIIRLITSLLRSRPSGCHATLPSLSGKRCVTSRETAAKETSWSQLEMSPKYLCIVCTCMCMFSLKLPAECGLSLIIRNKAVAIKRWMSTEGMSTDLSRIITAFSQEKRKWNTFIYRYINSSPRPSIAKAAVFYRCPLRLGLALVLFEQNSNIYSIYEQAMLYASIYGSPLFLISPSWKVKRCEKWNPSFCESVWKWTLITHVIFARNLINQSNGQHVILGSMENKIIFRCARPFHAVVQMLREIFPIFDITSLSWFGKDFLGIASFHLMEDLTCTSSLGKFKARSRQMI